MVYAQPSRDPAGMTRHQLCNFAIRKSSEPMPRRGVISAAGMMFAAIHRNNPGARAFRGVSHWSNPMDVKAIRHDAVDKDAPVAGLNQDNERVVETSIPARLDRLRWGRFHTRVVLALGITWILDGLEVTLAGALAGALRSE